MALYRILIAAVAANLALSGVAVAAGARGKNHEAGERKLALSQVPHGTLAGATEVFESVIAAKLVKLKDGRTVYEVTGKTHAGRTAKFYISASGQVLGSADADDDD